ncbi:hypothetical protein E0W41_07395 [Neisseria meningitidis]|nr:hypothetical protein [Neisseria meningitidis]
MPDSLDSRLRGNDGSFITFEYCCYPKVWIPACAGMTNPSARKPAPRHSHEPTSRHSHESGNLGLSAQKLIG